MTRSGILQGSLARLSAQMHQAAEHWARLRCNHTLITTPWAASPPCLHEPETWPREVGISHALQLQTPDFQVFKYELNRVRLASTHGALLDIRFGCTFCWVYFWRRRRRQLTIRLLRQREGFAPEGGNQSQQEQGLEANRVTSSCADES